jgi:hypothetical protein
LKLTPKIKNKKRIFADIKMAKVDRRILIAVSVILFLLVAAGIYQSCRAPVPLQPPQKHNSKENYQHRENYEMVHDSTPSAPSDDDNLKHHGLQGPSCGIGKASHLGYEYAVPEKPCSVEDMMPEEDACNASHFDTEAAQEHGIAHIFTYPLMGTILSSRAEHAGDMFRGDLTGIPSRHESCDFVPIHSDGDQLVHGAFSDYTRKAHNIIGCNKQFGSNDVWVKDTPSCVSNEQLVMDGDC